jgi:alpha-mannosidase
MALDGSVGYSAVKMPEDDASGRLLVRLYETEGRKSTASLALFCAPARAWLVDLNERPIKDAPAPVLDKHTVSVTLEPHTVVTLVVQFEGCRE